MTTATEVLWQLTDRGSCFGLVVRDGVVVDAAPQGRWLIGKDQETVLRLCVPRRITVEVL